MKLTDNVRMELTRSLRFFEERLCTRQKHLRNNRRRTSAKNTEMWEVDMVHAICSDKADIFCIKKILELGDDGKID